LTLVMAMLCGVPCVATGMGAQGEVIGQFGVAVEPGSPTAFIRGIKRVMEMPTDKRAFMAQGARKHALTNFVYVRSMQKYLQLYFDMVGRQALAVEDVPVPEIDASIPAPPPDMQIVVKDKKAANTVAMQDLADPDSIEEKVKESVTYKKLKPDPEPAPTPVVETPPREGDVLQIFEEDMSRDKTTAQNAMNERARGVADESEELLSPEMLQTDPTGKVTVPAGAEKTTVVASAIVPAVAKEVAASVTSPAVLTVVASTPSVSAEASVAKEVESTPTVVGLQLLETGVFMTSVAENSRQASLFEKSEPQPAAPQPATDSVQLELLADQPAELKLAANGSH
jgi:hypothetical protein